MIVREYRVKKVQTIIFSTIVRVSASFKSESFEFSGTTCAQRGMA